LVWLDRSRSIARSTALGLALSLFWSFVIVYNDLKSDFIKRLDLDFGGIDCEFGGPARLLLRLLNGVTTIFDNLI